MAPNKKTKSKRRGRGKRRRSNFKRSKVPQPLFQCSKELSKLGTLITVEGQENMFPSSSNDMKMCMTRAQAVSLVWKYAKLKDLKDPNPASGQTAGFICDKYLKKLFGVERIGFYELSGLLKPHLKSIVSRTPPSPSGVPVHTGMRLQANRPLPRPLHKAPLPLGPNTSTDFACLPRTSLHPSLLAANRARLAPNTDILAARIRELESRKNVKTEKPQNPSLSSQPASLPEHKEKATEGLKNNPTLAIKTNTSSCNQTVALKNIAKQPYFKASKRLSKLMKHMDPTLRSEGPEITLESDLPAIKAIAAYCKRYKLRDKNQKLIITCDNFLRKLLHVDSFSVEACARLIKGHLTPVEEDASDLLRPSSSATQQTESEQLPITVVLPNLESMTVGMECTQGQSSSCTLSLLPKNSNRVASRATADLPLPHKSARVLSLDSEEDGAQVVYKCGKRRIAVESSSDNEDDAPQVVYKSEKRRIAIDSSPDNEDNAPKVVYRCKKRPVVIDSSPDVEDDAPKDASGSSDSDWAEEPQTAPVSKQRNRSSNKNSGAKIELPDPPAQAAFKDFLETTDLDADSAKLFSAWVHSGRRLQAKNHWGSAQFEELLVEWICQISSEDAVGVAKVEPETSVLTRSEPKHSASPQKESVCCVCLENPRDSCIIHGDSGHQVCCFSCATLLKKKKKGCPICRMKISKVIRIFGG